MASKINSTWWTIPETHTYVAYSTNAFSSNFDKFDFESMSTMDTSIIPWGMGYCAAASTSYVHLEKSGTQWAYNGKLTKNENVVMCKTNNPFAMWGGYQNPYESNPWYIDQPLFNWIGAYNVANDDKVYSTADWTVNTVSQGSYEMPTANKKFREFKPVVYLDYQNFILRLDSISIMNKRTHATAGINSGNLTTWQPPSGTTWDEWELIGITYTPMYRSGNTWNLLNTGSSSSLGNYFYFWNMGEFDTPEDWQNIFYGEQTVNKVAPFQRYRDYIGMEKDTGSHTFTAYIPTAENWQNCDQYYLYYFFLSRAGRFVPLKQSFSDVSYQQKFSLFDYNGNEILIGNNLPSSSSTQDRLYPYIYYTISDYDGESSKMESWEKIALHELAFYGFPIYNKLHGVSEDGKHIGDEWYYLPDFDYTHMITNGGFFKGADALTKTNATWNDIFDDNIPAWDPTYFPPYPGGGGDEGEDDFGDLTNTRPTRYGTSGTKKYVCSASTINSLQSFLNVSYTPDNTNFIKDFKGTNPADYIVSIQRYPFPLPHVSSTASILIGGVDSELTANPLESTLVQAQRVFDFGSIAIPEYYGDFRDYESKITLFLPFIGSIELDPRLFIGHLLSVDYIIDYDTGSIAAEIQRDGLTIETKTAHISITIPFFAANMGAYQNSLAQTEFAIEQSKIKQISGIASTAISAGGAIAGAGAGLSDIGGASVAGGLIGGTASMFSGLVQMQSLEYQLDHTAPAIGSLSVAAPANAFYMDDRARVLIMRPKMLRDYSAADYSHTVGNACAIPGKLGSFTGYTVAAAADLSGIAATAAEKAMIRKQLQAGVYV